MLMCSLLSACGGGNGRAGAVFHVYDRKHLDKIPRRYTVEAGKTLSDTWPILVPGGVALEHHWSVARSGN
jgi:hypothetical protein